MFTRAFRRLAQRVRNARRRAVRRGAHEEPALHDTLVVCEPARMAARLGNETLVVCGAARGMTSVVSFLLYALEYPIGTRLQRRNLEDRDFMKALLDDDRLVPAPLARRPDLLALIERRNAAHARWGFKLPSAAAQLDELRPLLRNPVIVLCVRNPVATARSVVTRLDGYRDGFHGAAEAATRANAVMLDLMADASTPSIILDMDAARRDPATFVREFMDVLRLEGDADALAQTIARPGYKDVEPRPGISFHQGRP